MNFSRLRTRINAFVLPRSVRPCRLHSILNFRRAHEDLVQFFLHAALIDAELWFVADRINCCPILRHGIWMITRHLTTVVLFVQDDLELLIRSIIIRRNFKDAYSRWGSPLRLLTVLFFEFFRRRLFLHSRRLWMVDNWAPSVAIIRQVLIHVTAVALRWKSTPVAMLAGRHVLFLSLISHQLHLVSTVL